MLYMDDMYKCIHNMYNIYYVYNKYRMLYIHIQYTMFINNILQHYIYKKCIISEYIPYVLK